MAPPPTDGHYPKNPPTNPPPSITIAVPVV
jgi:hypothetical protein